MILAKADTERFYRAWFALLHFVNERLQLVEYFPSEWGMEPVSTQDAAKLRNALWADDALREAFIAENPASLNAADLALVTSWKRRLRGDFYFLRQLKKYAIFLPQGASTRAYGVLGLASSIDEVVTMQPALIQTTLLPFEGKIIYDGLVSPYNIYFGPGIRSSLNDAYRAAQERGELLTTLDPPDEATTTATIRANNKKLLAAFQKHNAGSNMSLATLESHRAAIERFAEDYLLPQASPRGLIALEPGDLAAYLAQAGKAAKPVSFRHFVRFLRDTNRIDWYDGQSLLDELKGA